MPSTGKVGSSAGDYLLGLTQSTKLLQQYQAKSKVPTSSKSIASTASPGTSVPTTPRKVTTEQIDSGPNPERTRDNRSQRQTEQSYDRKSRNIPIRSQSFRYVYDGLYQMITLFLFRTSDDERKNTSFEKAIVSNYRSQSYQTLSDSASGQNGNFESDTLSKESPLWTKASDERAVTDDQLDSQQLVRHYENNYILTKN